jgi:sarcosine oxidase subunit beta
MADSYDVIVIGAGVIGASIAFHLVSTGHLIRVLVVERDTVCSGNTRKSGAIVRMHYTNEPEVRLAQASLPYFQDWANRVGGDCGFRQTGFALLVGPENVERLRRNVVRLQSWGVNTVEVDGVALRDVMPSIATSGVALGAYEPTSGYADAVATTRSFMGQAKRRGAALLEGTPVLGITTAGGRVTGVETRGGPIGASVVVCAANAWSPKLLATAGVALPVTPRRAQVGYFKRPATYIGPHPVLLDTTTAMYTRAHGDGEIVGGAADVTGASPSDPDHYDEAVDAEFPSTVRQRLGIRVPALAEVPFAHGQAGLYDMSPDTRAIIDKAPGVEGLYLAAGFSGTGFKKAPAIGALLADWIVSDRPDRDLVPFRLGRFAEEAPIHGDDEYELARGWGHAF